jgi:hypothetical protein
MAVEKEARRNAGGMVFIGRRARARLLQITALSCVGPGGRARTALQLRNELENQSVAFQHFQSEQAARGTVAVPMAQGGPSAKTRAARTREHQPQNRDFSTQLDYHVVSTCANGHILLPRYAYL